MSKERMIVAPQAQNGLKQVRVGGQTPTVVKPIDDDSPAHRARLHRAEQRKTLVTLADQIAGETFYYRNHKWDSFNEAYPEHIDAHLRFVTKFYPNTQLGKGLYVDEPVTEKEMIACYEKQKIMKKKGLKHIVIEPHYVDGSTGETHLASTLEHCLQQIGEL